MTTDTTESTTPEQSLPTPKNSSSEKPSKTKAAAKKAPAKKSAAAKPTTASKPIVDNKTNSEAQATTTKPVAKKAPAKKSAAKKTSPKPIAPIIPDVEELTAFVVSLKSKNRKPIEELDDEVENPTPAPQQKTTNQPTPKGGDSAAQPKLQQLKQQLQSTQKAQQQPAKQQSTKQQPSGKQQPAKQQPAKQQPAKQQSPQPRPSEQPQQIAEPQHDTPAAHESTDAHSEQQISRREQRRLQWIEKQRQRREQRFMERQKRRDGRTISPDGDTAIEPNFDEELSADIVQPHITQQPQHSQEQQANQPSATLPRDAQKNNQKDNLKNNQKDNQKSNQKGNQKGNQKRNPKAEPIAEVVAIQPDATSTSDDLIDESAEVVTVTDVRSALAGFRKQPIEVHLDDDDRMPTDAQSSKRGGKKGKGTGDSRSQKQQDQPRADGKQKENKQDAKQQGKQQQKDGKQQQGKQQGKQQQAPQRHGDDSTPPIPEAQAAPTLPKRYFIPKDITQKPDVPDAVHGILEKVERYLMEELLVDDGANILIGVSGGVDSIVLLDMLYIISFESGFTITVAHVNHNLRGADSKRDEKFVRTISTNYKVQFHTTQVQVNEFAKRHSLSVEEAARELRYKFFRQTASTVRANYCATAHTADDAAETMLMNLFRGTGLTGLSSIPPRRPLVKKTTLIRPLLCLSKAEILEYATARGLEWQEDETNTLTKYTRNKVRHDLLPKIIEDYNPNIIESLNRTASLLRKADGFIDSLIHSTYTELVEEQDDKTTLDVNKLSALHEFLQGEILERAVSSITYGKTVSFAAIDRITSLFTKEAGTRETILNNLVALRERDSIVLMYEQHIQEVYLSLYKLGTYSVGQYTITMDEVHRNDVRIGQDTNVEYFDYDRLPYRLTLRTWHAGDTFHPIGMAGHTNVSDFLTNAKVEHSERNNVVVLCTATDIAWVCGMRMSDDFKITNDTRRIIRATYHKK